MTTDWSSDSSVLYYCRGLVAGSSDYVGYSEPSLKRAAVEAVGNLSGDDVVELGCGPNPVVLFELARRGRWVSAHELSEDFCRTAKLNA